PADLRDVTWDFLYALCRRDRATLPEGYFANTPTPFLMAPDGRTVAVLGPGLFEKRSVKLCSIVPGQEGALLPPMVVLGMPAFAPDGKTVAVAPPDRELQFWDLATATQTSRVRMDDTRGPLRVVAFSPDLRLAATAGLENTVQVRDAATGKPRLALEG